MKIPDGDVDESIIKKLLAVFLKPSSRGKHKGKYKPALISYYNLLLRHSGKETGYLSESTKASEGKILVALAKVERENIDGAKQFAKLCSLVERAGMSLDDLIAKTKAKRGKPEDDYLSVKRTDVIEKKVLLVEDLSTEFNTGKFLSFFDRHITSSMKKSSLVIFDVLGDAEFTEKCMFVNTEHTIGVVRRESIENLKSHYTFMNSESKTTPVSCVKLMEDCIAAKNESNRITNEKMEFIKGDAEIIDKENFEESEKIKQAKIDDFERKKALALKVKLASDSGTFYGAITLANALELIKEPERIAAFVLHYTGGEYPSFIVLEKFAFLIAPLTDAENDTQDTEDGDVTIDDQEST